MEKIYDVLVIGGGPAGYTAGLYTGRAALSTLVLERSIAGGQMVNAMKIDNYPGIAEGIGGFELAQQMKAQAERFGAESYSGTAVAAELSGPVKRVTLDSGETLAAKAVILAMGASPRPLGVPGEAELQGKGVSYCVTCDGMFFRDKTVVVVGGGNTGAKEALALAKLCKQVYLVHRRSEFRASEVYVELLEKTENITLVIDHTVTKIEGELRVTGVRLDNGDVLECNGVFVAVGRKPNSELVAGEITLEDGYIVAGETMETNLPGVFAAGDVRQKPMRQIITAASDGAVAAGMAKKYLLETK